MTETITAMDRGCLWLNFKNRVVNVAVDEINQHSNIWVKYTQRKSGRTITHFLFTFGEKEPKKPSPTKANGTKQLTRLRLRPTSHGGVELK